MRVLWKIKNNCLYIYLHGELDEYYSNKFRNSIDDILSAYPDVKTVIFDFTNLTFMDSTGIGVLLGRYKKIKSRKGEMYVQNTSMQIEKIFRLSGLFEIMPKIS